MLICIELNIWKNHSGSLVVSLLTSSAPSHGFQRLYNWYLLLLR